MLFSLVAAAIGCNRAEYDYREYTEQQLRDLINKTEDSDVKERCSSAISMLHDDTLQECPYVIGSIYVRNDSGGINIAVKYYSEKYIGGELQFYSESNELITRIHLSDPIVRMKGSQYLYVILIGPDNYSGDLIKDDFSSDVFVQLEVSGCVSNRISLIEEMQ